MNITCVPLYEILSRVRLFQAGKGLLALPNNRERAPIFGRRERPLTEFEKDQIDERFLAALCAGAK